MVFLDLANAFESVPHEILWTAFTIFHVPEGITKLVILSYFQDNRLHNLPPRIHYGNEVDHTGISLSPITTPKPCTTRLEKCQSKINWAGLKIKPNKSQSISSIEGQLTNERFNISDEQIPTILEKPIKSLGQWYNPNLNDAEQVEQLMQDTVRQLEQFNNKTPPEKLKV